MKIIFLFGVCSGGGGEEGKEMGGCEEVKMG